MIVLRIGDQLGHFLLVEVHHGHAEAGLQVVGERDVEREIDRILAELGRGLGERLLLELLVRGRPGDDDAVPPVAEQRRHLAAQLLAPRRIGIGAAARAGRLGVRRRASSFMNFMTSKMNGSAKVNSKLSGRQLTCGIDHGARLALLGGEVELLAMAARAVEVGEQGGPGDRHAVLAADLGHVAGRELAADGDLHQAALHARPSPRPA